MRSPNGDGCVPKLDHCNTTMSWENEKEESHHQQGLTSGTLTPDHTYNWWICNECESLYFFNMDKGSDQWTCDLCSGPITNCLECESAHECTLCNGDLIPSFLGDECIKEIDYCETPYLNYNNDGEDFMCPDCMEGYWPCGNFCQECDIDDYCIDCLDEEICTLCLAPYILNVDSTGCMEPLAHCEDSRSDYHIDYDRFWCDNCTVGYTWEWNHMNEETDFWSCQPCGAVMDHCVDCRQDLALNGPSERENGRCHQCEDDWMPTYLKDGCMMPFDNCDIEPENFRVVDDKFTCQECSDGFYWNWESWQCESCTDVDEHCLECNNYERALNIPQCSLCDNGFMHERDGLSCTLRFDHCSEQLVELQPTGLSYRFEQIEEVNRHVYFCADCFEGYFWSDEFRMCHSCFEDCLECTSEDVCTVCKDGMMP